MMSITPEIKADQNVEQLLTCWPQCIPVFLGHRMGCVGCSMARFENLADVSAIYDLHLPTFLTELNQAITAGADFACQHKG